MTGAEDRQSGGAEVARTPDAGPTSGQWLDAALTIQQRKALDTQRNIVLTAGAGSGKTRVLTERYLALLDPRRGAGPLAPDNILTITFTNKAATQMRARIQARIDRLLQDHDLDAGGRDHWLQVRDDLTSAPISTIHAFCSNLLRAYAIEAGLDPRFGVLEEVDVGEAREGAVEAVMKGGGEVRADVLVVLEHWNRYQLQTALLALLQKWQTAEPWCLQFAAAPPPGMDAEEARLLQAVSRLFLETRRRFQRLKQGGRSLDFDDLEQQTLHLLRTRPAVLADCRRRFRYVMVDEFQDTNEVQWSLIRELVAGQNGELQPDRLFVVGDPQQSIFAFRGADVSVFQKVIGEVREANRRHGAGQLPFVDPVNGAPLAAPAEELGGFIAMGDNFRGTRVLIDLSNYLFQQLMDPEAREHRPFEALFTPLVARRSGTSTIEFLLAEGGERRELPAAARQAQLIARRFRSLLDQGTLLVDTGEGYRPPRPGDLAILLKRRRYLPFYEQALREQGVPYRVTGGSGFYRAPEVQDLANLLQALLHPRRDIPLAGVLRSPVFGLTDEGLYWLSQAPGEGLAEKLEQAADDPFGADDRLVLARARRQLRRWRELALQLPPPEFLQALLAEAGLWSTVQAGERGPQGQANLEKLLHRARQLTHDGWGTLSDFCDRMLQLMRLDEREGEAPVLLEGEDTAKILTVHAAKGLEFPIVAVPELEMEMTQRSDDGPLIFDTAEGLAVKVLQPPTGRRTKYLLDFSPNGHQMHGLLGAKGLAEQKRLFYVALTRARDHLILAGSPPTRKANSWWAWFAGFFGTPGAEPLAFGWEERQHTIPVTREIPAGAAAAETAPALPALPDQNAAPTFARWEAMRAPLAAPARRATSPTRLLAYQHCAHRYYLEQVQGLEGPPDPALRRGRIIHRCFDLWSREPQLGEAAFDQAWAEAGAGAEADRERLRAECTDSWARFTASDLGRAAGGAAESYSEASLAAPVGNILVQGRVDRLFRGAEGWAVIDYKSGALAAEDAQRLFGLQLGLYALGVARLTGQEQVKTWLYLTDSGACTELTFSTRDLSAVEAEVIRLDAAIQARRFTPTAPMPADRPPCAWCPFRSRQYCSYYE